MASDYKDFEWVDFLQPTVLLAYSVNDPVDRYKVKKKYAGKFKNIAHQTSGVGCGHIYLRAMQLPLAASMRQPWQKWCDAQDGSDMGVFGTSFQECLKYYQFISGLGLTCDLCENSD